MSSVDLPTDNGSRRVTLKENKYKRVELVQAGAHKSIVKTFSGHEQSDCTRNARHTFLTLQLARARFQGVLRTPTAVAWHPTEACVEMEYLPELDAASPLSLKSIRHHRRFFEICYEIQDDEGILGDMRESASLTPRISELIESGFPQRLGFKGDLYSNLATIGSGLVLADVETATMEPLGLSELVLYIELFSTRNLPKTLTHLLRNRPRPVALERLTSREGKQVFEAAMEFFEMHRINRLSSVEGKVKVLMARWAFKLVADRSAS